MSPRLLEGRRSPTRPKPHAQARVFAALGDETRLRLISRLSDGHGRSISQLTEGSRLTRQAVTKHLRILERVGLVQNTRTGRQSLFALNPQPLDELKRYLERVSSGWDRALCRLKLLVEADGG